jgi:hypothetical protein
MQPIEALSNNDGDSAYEEDVASSTQSLTSSILHYRTMNGRTYHSDRSATAEYWCVASQEKRSHSLCFPRWLNWRREAYR